MRLRCAQEAVASPPRIAPQIIRAPKMQRIAHAIGVPTALNQRSAKQPRKPEKRHAALKNAKRNRLEHCARTLDARFAKTGRNGDRKAVHRFDNRDNDNLYSAHEKSLFKKCEKRHQK